MSAQHVYVSSMHDKGNVDVSMRKTMLKLASPVHKLLLCYPANQA